jgi:hypothetical protein
MTVKSCRICKCLLNEEKNDLCKSCAEMESLNVKKITDYLRTYENATNKSFSVKSLSKATGVKIQDIERLYKYNKLRGYIGLIDMDCKLCGDKFKPTIYSGVLCKNCTGKVEKIVKELKEAATYEREYVPIEKQEPVNPDMVSKTSGMHMKEDSKQRCGFKKR